MDFISVFLLFFIVYWFSDRLSRTPRPPYVEPWHRGISTEDLIGLYDSCDLLVFGHIEGLESMEMERNVMGAKHRLTEVHLDVRVELPENLRHDNTVISSCYFMQPVNPQVAAVAAEVNPRLNDGVCLGLFMRSARKGVFYLGSSNPFFRIRENEWAPYTRRTWIDIIPADRPLIGDHTDPGSTIH
jgi:hypothetical protein